MNGQWLGAIFFVLSGFGFFTFDALAETPPNTSIYLSGSLNLPATPKEFHSSRDTQLLALFQKGRRINPDMDKLDPNALMCAVWYPKTDKPVTLINEPLLQTSLSFSERGDATGRYSIPSFPVVPAGTTLKISDARIKSINCRYPSESSKKNSELTLAQIGKVLGVELKMTAVPSDNSISSPQHVK